MHSPTHFQAAQTSRTKQSLSKSVSEPPHGQNRKSTIAQSSKLPRHLSIAGRASHILSNWDDTYHCKYQSTCCILTHLNGPWLNEASSNHSFNVLINNIFAQINFGEGIGFLKLIFPLQFSAGKGGEFSARINTERSERNLSREQVTKLAKFLNLPEVEFISLWLCDKVLKAVGDDPLATQGIKKALTKFKN